MHPELLPMCTCMSHVSQVAKQLGYVEADANEDNWDLCWSDLSVSIEAIHCHSLLSYLTAWQV